MKDVNVSRPVTDNNAEEKLMKMRYCHGWRLLPVIMFMIIFGIIAIGPTGAAAQVSFQLPGGAKDIGVGGDAVWIVGTNNEIFRWNGADWEYMRGGGGTAIAVDPAGNAWYIGTGNSIQSWNGSGWDTKPGAAIDIGIGANGSVWIIGTNNRFYRWSNAINNWEQPDGGVGWGTRVAVDKDGNPWHVGHTEQWDNMYRWTGSGWEQRSGQALDIGIGADGSVWHVGTGNELYKWDGNGWGQHHNVKADKVAVDSRGLPWYTQQDNSVWVRRDSNAPIGMTFHIKAAANLQRVAAMPCTNILLADRGGSGGDAFQVVDAGGGKVALKDVGNNKFVSADRAGAFALVADRDSVGDWEKFTWFDRGNNAFALRAVNNKYVTAENVGNAPLIANRNEVGDWEQFYAEGSWQQLVTIEGTGGTRSGTLDAPFLVGDQQQAVSCKYQYTASGASSGIYDVTCTSAMGQAVIIRGMTGRVTSASDYELRTHLDNVAAGFPGISNLLNVVNGNVLNGLNSADIVIQGPAAGNMATISTLVSLGSDFNDVDQALQGLTDKSFMQKQFMVTATLQSGVVTATIKLWDKQRDGILEYRAPELGTSVRLNDLTLTFATPPKIIVVHGSGQFKLSNIDQWADTTIRYEKELPGTVRPSGTLTNLKKPFGVVPLTLNYGSYTGEFRQAGNKLVMKKMKINIEQATLLGFLKLSGKFDIDLDPPPSLSFALSYRMCGQSNSLAFDSNNLQDIPQQFFKIVTNLGSSIGACLANATCNPGYTRTGLQCDKTCPAPSTNSPGFCQFPISCSTVGLKGAFPSCIKPSGTPCPPGSTHTPGFCQFPIGCPAPLTGARPSCINPDNANPLIYPQ